MGNGGLVRERRDIIGWRCVWMEGRGEKLSDYCCQPQTGSVRASVPRIMSLVYLGTAVFYF